MLCGDRDHLLFYFPPNGEHQTILKRIQVNLLKIFQAETCVPLNRKAMKKNFSVELVGGNIVNLFNNGVGLRRGGSPREL